MTPTLRHLRAIALAAGLAASLGAHANKAFPTPEAAMQAFGSAVAGKDEKRLKDLLGPTFRELIPPVGAEDRQRFLDAWAKSHAVRVSGGKTARIAVGDDGWTLPIPLVKKASGWQFDTAAGAEEIRVRRIGRNELAAQQTLLAVHDAQREYASELHDGDPLRAYAARLASSPGKHDGLYWPTAAGEKPSPVGPALAAAATASTSPDGYHGYHYRLLTAQGSHATGGALDYMVRGKLLGGFAVLAWPARYWDTGVMTFMVNHDGQVYERDLGPNTAAKAAATQTYDPGPGWQKVAP